MDIAFPVGLTPTPQPIDPAPSPDADLPRADVVVITWTVDENNALADVLTPGYGRARWCRYAKGFGTKYQPFIRGGAPALAAARMGSYMPTKVGDLSVLCMKSELHLNQDGKRTGDGTATLPVKDFFDQIIDEANPKVFLTIGTSGSVFEQFGLGDAVISRAAKFRLKSEFRNEAFNGNTYRSDWQIPTDHLDAAVALMQPFGTLLERAGVRAPHEAVPLPGGPHHDRSQHAEDQDRAGRARHARVPSHPDDGLLRVRHVRQPPRPGGVRGGDGRRRARDGR